MRKRSLSQAPSRGRNVRHLSHAARHAIAGRADALVALKHENLAHALTIQFLDQADTALRVGRERQEERKVSPSRLVPPRRENLEKALTGVRMPEPLLPGHSYPLVLAEAFIQVARALMSEAVWLGALEGCPVLTEPDNAVHLRLLHEQGLSGFATGRVLAGRNPWEVDMHTKRAVRRTRQARAAVAEADRRLGKVWNEEVLPQWDGRTDQPPGWLPDAATLRKLIDARAGEGKARTADLARLAWFAELLDLRRMLDTPLTGLSRHGRKPRRRSPKHGPAASSASDSGGEP